MKPGEAYSMIRQKLQKLQSHLNSLSHFGKLSRRKRQLVIGLLILLVFLLLVLLFQSGSQDVAIKANAPADHSEVTAIGPPLQTPGEVEDKDNTSSRTPGYRKSSDFFQSIVRGNSHAVCVGSDEAKGEVEDLFCMPRPRYDSRMKNPCWWENITQTPAPGVEAPSKSVKSLNCLPYFHILCCSKSGTTDLYRRISLHPDIVPNFGQFGKERLWWSWLKYGYRTRHDKGDPLSFTKYVKGFGILARYLEGASSAVNPKDLRRLITVDGSPPDMWDLRGWTQLPQNRGLRHPAVITPHLMRHLYRDPKFIVLARDPVERLYTAYLFHGLGRSSEEFHRDAVRGIEIFNRCLDRAVDRIECFVNASVFRELTVDLHFSCYVVYFEEWLKVFPKRHFLFLRTEEYNVDIKGSILKVFKFLDLPKPSSSDLQKMVSAPISYHTKQKDLAGPMMNRTRTLLRDWFRPWNQELARLMKDKGYLWKDEDEEEDDDEEEDTKRGRGDKSKL